MLEINDWLVIAVIASLSIQGIQLGQLRYRWAIWLAGLVVVLFSFSVSEFIATQNILTWQKLVTEQQQTLQIIVLLELSLTLFLQYKFLPVSSALALFYGQLLFFQQGWFDWSFQWQGGIFGVAICCLWGINMALNQIEKYWPLMIFFVVALCSIVSAATPSQPVIVTTNWQEMIISLLTITSVIFAGLCVEKFRNIRKP